MSSEKITFKREGSQVNAPHWYSERK
uniref:Uncharacterized protein n=1 Tax=Anguilla anguilla TaxID=7936 RepID=A0A0E9V1T2_ANGAN